MPPPLSEGIVDDSSRAGESGDAGTIDQYAADVSAFLQWTAWPRIEDRQKIALRVYANAVLLCLLITVTRKRSWGGRRPRD